LTKIFADNRIEERILGLFRDPRDAGFAASIFERAEIPFLLVADGRELCAEIGRGVGAIVVTEDALFPNEWEELYKVLDLQPEWSAVPVICLLSAGIENPDLPALLLPSEILLVDQPVRIRPLLAVVRAALKSRRRQYFLRDKIVELNGEIEKRIRAEEELRLAKDELEARVAERTTELTGALDKLRTETEERIRAVEELRERDHLLMQQSRLAAMGEMLVDISHQWRQPLNVVGLILQGLTRSYDDGAFTGDLLKTRVARGLQLINHMSRTIDDFRSFLNAERVRTTFQVREVVDKAVSMVAETLKEVEVQVTAEEPAPMEGYPNEFAQVVMNILLNAGDAFRDRKTADPRVAIHIFRHDGRSVVTIADNAGGIAPEIIDRIFHPYFTTKPPDKGTGIGLFMTKTIIEKNMNGRLTVRNTDEGAEFRIEV
jgi:C4-dicarboxylate-specific signal transduction histidine kinase